MTTEIKNDFVKWIRKWGYVNTDGLLEETTHFFTSPDHEGFIGYRVENSHAIVFGEPVASEETKPLLAKAFQDFCASKNWGVVYTMISKEFAEWTFHHQSASIIEWGKNFILDPAQNPTKNKGSNGVLVRKKVKHALRDQVLIHEYQGNDPLIEKSLSDVASEWLERRRGPQIYLAHVTLFEDRLGKRWFYAEQNGRLIGILVLNELQEKKGWLLNNVMLLQNAPNGTSELLIVSALETLEKENCHYVVAGPVTTTALGEMKGINRTLSELIRLVFKGAKMIFHLEGYETYWIKFNPQLEPSYLSFPEKNISFSSIKALITAYNMNMG